MSELPRGWVEASIGEMADISSGVGFPKDQQGKAQGDFPFAKVRDISQAVLHCNGILQDANNYIDKDDLPKLKAKPIPAGSTVFAKN